MQALTAAIPDVKLLLDLEPEELAAKILFLVRTPTPHALSGNNGFLLGNLLIELWPHHPLASNIPQYPRERMNEVNQAITEAWAWLEVQGLLVPAPNENGRNGWRVLSRRARRIETESDFADYRSARLLPKEHLHPKIADVVWGAFVRGRYDSAVFEAMKAVEVAVRTAGGFGKEHIGRGLMELAFSPDKGSLTDMSMDKNERKGRMELFTGAFCSYKNPQSHRDVNLDDPREALEIIYLANHLLRIVDARAKARAEAVHA